MTYQVLSVPSEPSGPLEGILYWYNPSVVRGTRGNLPGEFLTLGCPLMQFKHIVDRSGSLVVRGDTTRSPLVRWDYIPL